MSRITAWRRFLFSVCVCVVGALAMSAGAARAEPISIAMVLVGNPGNAPDPNGGYGAVSYSYSIGKYDVTSSQYAAFLNAVASTDTYGLYNSFMDIGRGACGIVQNGSSGSYTYSVVAGDENYPVNNVGWGDAARFVNWLQNGQPTGAEGSGTTETGTYSLNGATTNAALMAMSIVRNPNATWVLPTENEWYKAAYYKGGGLNAGYWLYPTQSSSMPSNVLSTTGTNNANFYNGGYTDPTNGLTPVGTFAGSPGPYGTFDQGGDVSQWNETAITATTRGVRGGSWDGTAGDMWSLSPRDDVPSVEESLIGFRVASVPEPGGAALILAGAIGLWAFRRRQIIRGNTTRR